jgi:hypothetical protein
MVRCHDRLAPSPIRAAGAGPIGRCKLAAGIGQDVGVIIFGLADGDDAGFVALGGAARVNGDDDAAEYRRGVAPQLFDTIAVPQSARNVVQQPRP